MVENIKPRYITVCIGCNHGYVWDNLREHQMFRENLASWFLYVRVDNPASWPQYQNFSRYMCNAADFAILSAFYLPFFQQHRIAYTDMDILSVAICSQSCLRTCTQVHNVFGAFNRHGSDQSRTGPLSFHFNEDLRRQRRTERALRDEHYRRQRNERAAAARQERERQTRRNIERAGRALGEAIGEPVPTRLARRPGRTASGYAYSIGDRPSFVVSSLG